MAKRKTHEQFIEEMKIKQPNIEVLETYKGSNVPILCKCKIDGYEWSPRPKHLLSNHGCPQCGIKSNSKQRTKTHEEFLKKFNEKFPNSNIEIIGKYIGAEDHILCKCKIDGHEWYITPHNLLKGRSCPQCKIRNFTGENNPRWNNELTDEERNEERNTVEYKQWRDECFKRDNYTCQLTGEVGGRLEVHHIYSYDKHKELRFEVDNGITISKDIHKLFHSIYGYGSNTREQWEEFVKNFK